MIATEKDLKISYLFDFYGEILSEKQQLAVDLYYNSDFSLSEVAQQLGISRQGVRDSLKRSESALYDMESKLGLARKFEGMLEDVGKIKRSALEISRIDPSENSFENIRSLADEIVFYADELEKRF